MGSPRPRVLGLVVAIVTSAAGSLSGCDDDCTLVGCAGEPVSLVLLGPNWMPLEPAVYELGFELDGISYAATCSTLDGDQACEPLDGTAPDFDVSVFVTTNNQIRINVTADRDERLPEDFRVSVSVVGSPLVEESGSFEYTEARPNGPDCAPTCRTSDGAFVFVEL